VAAPVYDAPEVATADPDADDGVEADDEPDDDEDDELDDEPDEVDDEPDDELAALVAAAREPLVPAAALCCAEAGRATAIAAAAAALTTPAPAVTAASRARPRPRACVALASPSPAESCSVDMITPVHRRSVEHLRHPGSPPGIKGECRKPQRLR